MRDWEIEGSPSLGTGSMSLVALATQAAILF
jgi:hypothetical protein